MTARRSLHAFLDPADHDAWHAAAAELGCTTTALVVAVTAELPDLTRKRSVQLAARRLDASRRRRIRGT